MNEAINLRLNRGERNVPIRTSVHSPYSSLPFGDIVYRRFGLSSSIPVMKCGLTGHATQQCPCHSCCQQQTGLKFCRGALIRSKWSKPLPSQYFFWVGVFKSRRSIRTCTIPTIITFLTYEGIIGIIQNIRCLRIVILPLVWRIRHFFCFLNFAIRGNKNKNRNYRLCIVY